MLKIVCLIRHEPPLIYFVNRINEVHMLASVVVEFPEDQVGLARRILSKGMIGAAYAIWNRLRSPGIKRKMDIIHDEFFGDKWKTLDPRIPVLKVRNINSPQVVEHIRELQPDLVLDHGTSLVKDEVLQPAKLALNLHWGLSPYYRGTYCTDWALLNWDPYNIGVTIHKLTNVVDGGSIVAQKRAEVKPTDTVHSINMQLTHMGTELVIEIIERLKRGEQLTFHKQDLGRGYMTRYSQYGVFAQLQVEHIIRHGLLKTMLEKPARRQRLPIVEL